MIFSKFNPSNCLGKLLALKSVKDARSSKTLSFFNKVLLIFLSKDINFVFLFPSKLNKGDRVFLITNGVQQKLEIRAVFFTNLEINWMQLN